MKILIITRDRKDFIGSSLPVYAPTEIIDIINKL